MSDWLCYLPLASWEQIIFCCLFLNLAILNNFLGSHSLSGLFSILVGVNWWCLNCLSFMSILIIQILFQKLIQVFSPSIMENWLERLILKANPSVSEEVIKYIMSSYRNHLSKHQIIIVLPLVLIAKSIVGLIDFNELLMGLLISRVRFGVILKR